MLSTDPETFHALIVGAGPAGASCALWCKQLGLSAMLIEKGSRVGGLQLVAPGMYSNYFVVTSPGRIPDEIAGCMQENLNRHGVPYITGVRESRLEIDPDRDPRFRAFIESRFGRYVFRSHFLVLATGSRPKNAGFHPSDRVIVGGGDARLREGEFFRNKSVAILGGGDSAYENHIFVQRQRPRCVHVYARTIRASRKLRVAVASEDVFDAAFTADPETMTVVSEKEPHATRTYDYFVVLFGYEAVTVFPELELACNERGFILTNESAWTSHPKVLAIGEATHRMHPCVATSTADGVIAAKSLQRAVEEAGGR